MKQKQSHLLHSICRHIVELKEKEMGPQHTSVAAAINNLAVFYCFKVNTALILVLITSL